MENGIIPELIAQNKRLVIPGFGTFLLKDDLTQNIVLTPFLKNDDGVLTGALCQKHNVDARVSHDMIKKFIADINESLSTIGKFYIVGVGVLTLDANGVMGLVCDQCKTTRDNPKQPEPQFTPPPTISTHSRMREQETAETIIQTEPKLQTQVERPRQNPLQTRPIPGPVYGEQQTKPRQQPAWISPNTAPAQQTHVPQPVLQQRPANQQHPVQQRQPVHQQPVHQTRPPQQRQQQPVQQPVARVPRPVEQQPAPQQPLQPQQPQQANNSGETHNPRQAPRLASRPPMGASTHGPQNPDEKKSYNQMMAARGKAPKRKPQKSSTDKWLLGAVVLAVLVVILIVYSLIVTDPLAGLIDTSDDFIYERPVQVDTTTVNNTPEL